MATARELLEQADELMRRNRGRVDSDIPVLTDSVDAVSTLRRAPPPDIPVLTEKVDAVAVHAMPPPDQPIANGPVLEGDPSDWLVMDTIDPAMHSVTGRAPDTLAVVPPFTLKSSEHSPGDAEVSTRATFKAAGSAATPPPVGSTSGTRVPLEPTLLPPPIAAPADAPVPMVPAVDALAVQAAPGDPWQGLAEQVSMQVLQRVDLFTDAGLKDQLTQHLQPIVDRASAELVAAINEQVGKLIRSYVAEAIEREIAQWRRDHH